MFPLYVAVKTAIEVVPWLFLFLLFFRKQHRYSIKTTILIICTYIAAITLATCLCVLVRGFDVAFFTKWRFPLSIISTVCLTSICAWLVRGRLAITLFVSLIIKNYLDTLDLSTQLLGQSIFIKFPALASLCFLLVTLPLIYWFMIRLLKPVLDVTGTMRLWKHLWMIPLSFYFIFRLGVMSGYTKGSAALETISPVLPYIWFFVTFIIYYLILRALNEALQFARLREQLYFSEIKAAAQRREYQHLQEDIKSAKAIQYGIYRTLQQLDQLAADNQIRSLRNCIQLRLSQVSDGSFKPVCENHAVDMVIRHYLNLAEEHQIKVDYKVNVSKALPFSEIDISIILGNLLENAVQACCRQNKGEKTISLNLHIHNFRLLLSIQNSFCGEIRQSGDAFLSSKRKGHGLGIASVRNIAEKYNGVLQINYENHLFCVNLLMENTDDKEREHE